MNVSDVFENAECFWLTPEFELTILSAGAMLIFSV
jgi:hypothetical protein